MNIKIIILLHPFQMLRVRSMLTEVLLAVTNEELQKVAREVYEEAVKGK